MVCLIIIPPCKDHISTIIIQIVLVNFRVLLIWNCIIILCHQCTHKGLLQEIAFALESFIDRDICLTRAIWVYGKRHLVWELIDNFMVVKHLDHDVIGSWVQEVKLNVYISLVVTSGSLLVHDLLICHDLSNNDSAACVVVARSFFEASRVFLG